MSEPEYHLHGADGARRGARGRAHQAKRALTRRGRGFALVAALVAPNLAGCDLLNGPSVMPPQTVALIATPKIVADFDDPLPSARAFLTHYAPLLSRARETVVVFAVGNSEHILTYRGRAFWADTVEWARYTAGVATSERVLDYRQLDGIVRAFRDAARALGLTVKIFDQVDQGIEFTHERFKLDRHPECMAVEYEHSFDIRARMRADTFVYATVPGGVAEGTRCGHFLAEQVGAYLEQLGFDGIMYGNQLGTRGRWQPDKGPGYSAEEAEAIRQFFAYTQQVLGDRELLWFDSYNNVEVERNTYGMTQETYADIDYLLAAGFCVITFPDRYVDNLVSKLPLRDRTRVLATLDYVDPWYEYKSMVDYAAESANLERVAIAFRRHLDGVLFFANDSRGELVPQPIIASFAARYFDRN